MVGGSCHVPRLLCQQLKNTLHIWASPPGGFPSSRSPHTFPLLIPTSWLTTSHWDLPSLYRRPWSEEPIKGELTIHMCLHNLIWTLYGINYSTGWASFTWNAWDLKGFQTSDFVISEYTQWDILWMGPKARHLYVSYIPDTYYWKVISYNVWVCLPFDVHLSQEIRCGIFHLWHRVRT